MYKLIVCYAINKLKNNKIIKKYKEITILYNVIIYSNKIIENRKKIKNIIYNKNRKIDVKAYYKDELFHRKGNLPAIIQYHKNGEIAERKFYKDGKLHRDYNLPAYTEYYKNGELKIKIYYINGKLRGDNTMKKPSYVHYDAFGIEQMKTYVF